MLNERTASLFRNGRNQAIRIPREFEFEGTEVVLRKEGKRLIIEPALTKHPFFAFLEGLEPLNESLPEIEDLPPLDRELF